MRLHITNGRLIDPAAGVDRRADLYIADGHVAAVDVAPADSSGSAHRGRRPGGAAGPGGSMRAPGRSRWLAIARCAARRADGRRDRLVQPPDGGVMLDDPARVHAFLNESPAGPCRIHAVGALTPGLRGEALAELRLLAQAGCLAFGQGEAGLSDTRLLWNAMRYAAGAGLALWLRPQDPGWRAAPRRPAAPMPRGWAWKACRTWLKRWPCKHCSNCSATPARACTCRACPAPPAWRGCARPSARPARQLRRVGQSSAPDRRGHRFLRCPLPPAAAAASATATRSAPRWPTAPSTRCARTIRR